LLELNVAKRRKPPFETRKSNAKDYVNAMYRMFYTGVYMNLDLCKLSKTF